MSNKPIKITIIVLSTILALMILFAGVTVCCQNTESYYPQPTPEIVEDTPEPTPEIIEVESITIQLESNEVYRGTSLYPEVIIQPWNATDKFFELHSDNLRVLRSQGSHWIAADIGTANLIATAPNGVTAKALITVTAPALETISFPEDEITLTSGDILMLSPILTPSEAFMYEPIRFSSNNESVVTVSADGRVTAVGGGTATIKATVGEISTELEVTVVVPVRRINVTINRNVFSIGEQAEFIIEVEPPDASNASVSMSFSGASVTPVGENAFICNEAGEVTVTVTAENGLSASHTITVVDLDVFASEVHRLTNIERENAGLSPLERYQPLDQAASVRANEIVTYFSHTRPDGRAFHTVFAENNVHYIFAGENLAVGHRNPAEVIQGWMDSPGHREAILKSEFGRLGVGVVIDNEGTLYWAQLFTD